MKKILFFLVCLIGIIQTAFSQCVTQQLGPDNFNGSGEALYTDIATDQNGVPYVVYADSLANWKATVMKYNGSSWFAVGAPGFSAGGVAWTSIAIDGNNVPYVVYQDSTKGNAATVMKFNGSAWITVGSAGFTPEEADYTIIAIDQNNTPYIVYADTLNNNDWVTVMKYTGSSWSAVGKTRFGNLYNITFFYHSLDMAIDSNGIPYVVYSDAGNGNAATVMTFNGSNWTAVGIAGFSAGAVNYTSIAINPINNMPYVIYSDHTYGWQATVMQFDGNIWTTLGAAGFSGGIVNWGVGIVDTDIEIDKTGTPYVIYTDSTANWESTVMTYNGNSWIKLTIPAVPNYDRSNSIAIDNTNIPYVGFSHRGSYAYKLCNDNTSTLGTITNIPQNKTLIHLYPNPNNGSFSVELNTDAQISITNTLGQVVLTEFLSVGKHDLDLQSQTPGIYLLQADMGGNTQSLKIIKSN